ncbi:MFS transporter [Pseudomonas tolaasii]
MNTTVIHPSLSIGKTALLGLLQILTWGGSFYLMAVLADPVVADTGWSREWVLGSVSIGLLTAGVVSPACGRLLVRYGGRRVLACHGFLMAAGLWIMASAHTLPLFLAAWVLMGMGMAAGLYDALFSALGALYGMKARGTITGVTLISGFCTTLIWPLLALLVHTLGWRGTCYLYGLVLMIGIYPLYQYCLPHQQTPSEKKPTTARTALSMDPTLYWLMTVLFSLSAVLMTAISVVVIVLLQERGNSLAAAIALSAIIGPASVGSRIVDLLTRNKHPMWTMLVSVFMTAVGLCMLAFTAQFAAWALVLYGAGNGLRAIVRSTLPLAIVPLKDYAMVSSKMAAPVYFSQAMTPLAIGYLLALTGAEVTVSLLAVLSIATLAVACYLVLSIRHNDSQGKNA